MRVIVATLSLFFFSVVASAHHSRAEFSSEVQEIEGEIVSVTWANPHPRITLKIVNDAGEEEILQVQVFSDPVPLARAGVTDELFGPGDHVTMVGRRSTRRASYLLGTNMLLADGREAILTRTVGPHWSGEYVGGTQAFLATGPKLADAASENRGLFRVWSRPEVIEGPGLIRYLPLTDAAIAAKTQFNLVDNWRSRGEVPGMPMVMLERGSFEIVNEGATITISLVNYDIVRTIYLGDSDSVDNRSLSKLGYSVGYREGNTLVVITKGINWPHFDQPGTPLSEAAEITETFTLSDDQGRLDFHMTVTDPATFTEPATVERFWVAYAPQQ